MLSCHGSILASKLRSLQQTQCDSLPHGEVAAALATVQASGAWAGTKLAFGFLVLTATRSGEVRGARWTEIDQGTALWTVPAGRAKNARPHRVPLSAPALDMLTAARKLPRSAGLVFPSANGREISNATMGKLLRENGIDAVPHGFRSSFRYWCDETGVPREVAEACLAHTVADATEAAYARSDLLARRRDTMEAWGQYITTSNSVWPVGMLRIATGHSGRFGSAGVASL